MKTLLLVCGLVLGAGVMTASAQLTSVAPRAMTIDPITGKPAVTYQMPGGPGDIIPSDADEFPDVLFPFDPPRGQIVSPPFTKPQTNGSVPEPSTFALVGLGLGLAALVRKIRS